MRNYCACVFRHPGLEIKENVIGEQNGKIQSTRKRDKAEKPHNDIITFQISLLSKTFFLQINCRKSKDGFLNNFFGDGNET